MYDRTATSDSFPPIRRSMGMPSPEGVSPPPGSPVSRPGRDTGDPGGGDTPSGDGIPIDLRIGGKESDVAVRSYIALRARGACDDFIADHVRVAEERVVEGRRREGKDAGFG